MHYRLSAARGAALLAAAASVALAPSVAVAQSRNATAVYRVDLQPLNGSGVQGHAILRLRGNELTVVLNARGLEPGGPHPGHIHGFTSGENAVCPTQAADDDGDGFVELAEGGEVYGPVLLTLAPNLDPDLDGKVHFKMTYTIAPSLLPLTKRHIVLHGMTDPPTAGTGTTGEVDGNDGFEPLLPVACGEIRQVGGDAMRFRSRN